MLLDSTFKIAFVIWESHYVVPIVLNFIYLKLKITGLLEVKITATILHSHQAQNAGFFKAVYFDNPRLLPDSKENALFILCSSEL